MPIKIEWYLKNILLEFMMFICLNIIFKLQIV